MSMSSKIWHDETAFASKIDNLNFSIDSLGILSLNIVGDKNNTNFKFTLNLNNTQIANENFDLKDGETKNIQYYINQTGNLTIEGEISGALSLPPYSGRIEAIYNTNYQISNWHDETVAISFIENLYLTSKDEFKNPKLVLQGNKKTKCILSVLFNGEVIKNLNSDIDKNQIITINLNENTSNKKGVLQVFGFIQNETLFGASANISLFEDK